MISIGSLDGIIWLGVKKMLNELYPRSYQQVMRLGMKVLKIPKPALLEGENSLLQLPQLIVSKGIKRVLIVTDKGITSIGLMNSLLEQLTEANIAYVIFDETVPNPTIQNIEDGKALYMANRCEGIIAFGGGSPIDCAKGIAARIVRPDKTIPQMKGMFKVLKEMPPFFAVPTTAGTGSEATVAAVISNPETHEKYPIMDYYLVPHYAILDPNLTVNLPKHITSTTGMDALTHAVEAYIGRSNTNETREFSREAIQLIYDNLLVAYKEPHNLEARANMQRAAYLAGMAFTRAYVGYVHAIAHTLGGFYNVPHGLANAVIMPYVFEYYGESAHKPLAELADLVGLATGKSEKEQAEAFIEWIKEMNRQMDIPTKIEGIQTKDIPTMAKRALAEANPLYPVPKMMNINEMAYMYLAIRA